MDDARATPVERRQIYYSGQVQGVGFRYAARQIAERYAVTGYVRNLPDGRVELAVEGDPSELNNFLAAVNQRMSDYVNESTVEMRPGTNEFHRFEIRP